MSISNRAVVWMTDSSRLCVSRPLLYGLVSHFLNSGGENGGPVFLRAPAPPSVGAPSRGGPAGDTVAGRDAWVPSTRAWSGGCCCPRKPYIQSLCFKRSVEFNRILLRFDKDVFVISNLFGIQGRWIVMWRLPWNVIELQSFSLMLLLMYFVGR